MKPFWHPWSVLLLPEPPSFASATVLEWCLALTQELEQASFVRAVSCEPYVQLEPGDPDPDEPVTNDLP